MGFDINLGALADRTLSDVRAKKAMAIGNLSSGKKRNLSRHDPGSYSLGLSLDIRKKYESSLSTSLQNAISIAQAQQSALGRMQNSLTRINEIASMASSANVLSGERELYQAQFQGLISDFETLQEEIFNGVALFGNTMGDEEKQFLESLKTHWLAATEKLVKEQYDWEADSADSWDLVIEENGAIGGSAAFVRSAWGYSNPTNPVTDYASEVVKMSFDLPDFPAPHTVGNSTADTTVAHEMVHLLQAQNSYMGDQAGGNPGRDMTWLSEGLAEFIRGADSRANSSKNSIGTAALVQKPGSGWDSGTDDYAGAYLAVKYLDSRIRASASGQGNASGHQTSSGIKHLTTWMRDQRDADAGASNSGLEQYFGSFNIRTSAGGTNYYTNINSFLTDFESSGGGQSYVNGLNLTDLDTGSIAGSEYNPGNILSSADVVNDNASYLSGFTSKLTYVEEEVEDPPPLEIGGSQQLQLQAINPLSFGDTSTYNLKSESGAVLVLSRVEELIELIGSNLGQVVSNINAIETHANMLNMRQTSLANAISRINDVSVPEESLNISKSEILLRSNLAMRTQANGINQDIMLAMLDL